MNNLYPRGGHEPYARAPSTFRDSLAELRDRVRDGLAEAASRAVSGAVRRAAESLLGDGGEEEATPSRQHARRRYEAARRQELAQQAEDQATRSQASSSVATGRLVSRIHSSGLTPLGGSTSATRTTHRASGRFS